MGFGKTFTSVVAGQICTFATVKGVVALPLSIVLANTPEEWVNIRQNDYSGIIGGEPDWYLLQRLHSASRRLLEIQTTPALGHPAVTSALEPITVITMAGVAETLKSVIVEMTYGTGFKLVNLSQVGNANLTHKDLNMSSDEPETRWNIHIVSYDPSTSRARPSSNGLLSLCSWSFGIFDESHQYKTQPSVGWQIAMKARIGFKLQVTTTAEFHSIYYWCCQMMWLFSVVPEDPDDDTGMEKHSTEALYSVVKSLMHAVRIKTCQWETTSFASEREFTSAGTKGNGGGSSAIQPARPEAEGISGSCHTLIRVNTVWLNNNREFTFCWSRMDWGRAS